MARTVTWLNTSGSTRRLAYKMPDPTGAHKELYIEAVAVDAEASSVLAASSTASGVNAPSGWAGAGTTGANTDLAGTRMCGFIIGPAWTAGTLSFEVSLDGVTWVPLHNPVDGTLISYTVQASRAYSVDPAMYAGWRFIRPKSSVSQALGTTVTIAAQVV